MKERIREAILKLHQETDHEELRGLIQMVTQEELTWTEFYELLEQLQTPLEKHQEGSF